MNPQASRKPLEPKWRDALHVAQRQKGKVISNLSCLLLMWTISTTVIVLLELLR